MQRKFAVGDKVIQTVNDYSLGVMNGTIGCVVGVATGPGGGYRIDFDGCGERLINDGQVLNVYVAYAHGAQSSEFP